MLWTFGVTHGPGRPEAWNFIDLHRKTDPPLSGNWMGEKLDRMHR